MSAIITEKFRKHNANQFHESFSESSANTFTGPCFNKDKDSPPIKLCIPPISGGKFLVDITNII